MKKTAMMPHLWIRLVMLAVIVGIIPSFGCYDQTLCEGGLKLPTDVQLRRVQLNATEEGPALPTLTHLELMGVSSSGGKNATELTYTGTAKFTPTDSGSYILAAARGVWIDVIDSATQQVLQPSSHQHLSSCGSLQKAVTFVLSANHVYRIRLSKMKEPKTPFLIEKLD